MDDNDSCFECGVLTDVDDACETCKAALCVTCAYIGLGYCATHRAEDIGTDIRRRHYYQKSSYALSLTTRLRGEAAHG